MDTDSRVALWSDTDWLQIWPVRYWLEKKLSGALWGKLLEHHLRKETYSKGPEWQKVYVYIKILPQGVVCPYPGAIHMYKNMKNSVHKGLSLALPGAIYMWKNIKNVYKIRIQRSLKLATNGRSDKGFLLISEVCPLGVFCPCPGAVYMYKIIKNVYKIRFRRDHFETCNIWAKIDLPKSVHWFSFKIWTFIKIKHYSRQRYISELDIKGTKT